MYVLRVRFLFFFYFVKLIIAAKGPRCNRKSTGGAPTLSKTLWSRLAWKMTTNSFEEIKTFAIVRFQFAAVWTGYAEMATENKNTLSLMWSNRYNESIVKYWIEMQKNEEGHFSRPSKKGNSYTLKFSCFNRYLLKAFYVYHWIFLTIDEHIHINNIVYTHWCAKS